MELLYYYREMLAKHIDLLERRLIKGETIPHAEKVFSVFQDCTEMIKKGKLRPNVEIGKKVAITTDQYDLIVDWQIADNQTDNQLTGGLRQPCRIFLERKGRGEGMRFRQEKRTETTCRARNRGTGRRHRPGNKKYLL